MLPRRFSPLILAACFLLACSPRSYVVSRMADAASSGGDVFARDDDPELVRDAIPFALKAMAVRKAATKKVGGTGKPASAPVMEKSSVFIVELIKGTKTGEVKFDRSD